MYNVSPPKTITDEESTEKKWIANLCPDVHTYHVIWNNDNLQWFQR